jgi:uncharacterized protein (TIGR03032 family)
VTSEPEPDDGSEESAAGGPRRRAARFRYSPSFLQLLGRAHCTLLVSTYQVGQLIAIGLAEDGLAFSMHQFDQAMGLAANERQLAVGARGQVWFMADSSHIAPRIAPAGRYDRAYLARSAIVTGQVHGHELAWGVGADGQPELWQVNTRFSCLANLDPAYSFVPRWRPPFISQLAAEDRCHLNGVAMRDGRPAFVTAMSQTDTAGGWREDKNNTGCVLDVASGEVVTSGLAMPHSPRLRGGRLLVLNSGYGTLEAVDLADGRRERIAKLPGFTRGLACYGNLAFVGLSRIRETAVFGGVPIAERHAELKCGIGVIDLVRGATVATLEFESEIEEIFDVQVIAGARAVALSGDRPDGPDAHEIWVVPPASERIAPRAATDAIVGDWRAHARDALAEGRPADAVAFLRQVAAARPGSAEIANDLGNALQSAGDQTAAIEAYRRAVAADPAFAPALQNLGYLLISEGYTDEGVEQLARAQSVRPLVVNRVMIATALPVIYASAADASARWERMREAVAELASEDVGLDTTDQLVPTGFSAAYAAQDTRPASEQLGRIYSGPSAPSRAKRKRAAGARVRVGLLSAYFCNHTVGGLNIGRVERLSRERFEVVVLSASRARDGLASRYAQAADRLVELPRELPAARKLIAEQQLDLLLFTDVGMDALTSTLAHSRMAPVQCATWGHPVTTGSRTIDHFISSELLEIEGAEAHYTEQLVRLPSLGTYYERPAIPERPAFRERLGLSADAHLYGCPQTLFKFHPAHDHVFAEILRADPAGELVLIEARSAHWTELLRERFARTMPDVTDRIRWLAPLPRDAFLALLAACDLSLDPIAFGGGNTSYEALAMGTPVVTLPGPFMRTRITAALYAKAGYDELIATSEEDYVAKALRLGTDSDYRDGVREQIAARCGVLYEDPSEIADLEVALSALASGT